jgi:hypothetical protein
VAQTGQEIFANIPSTITTGSSGTTAPVSGTAETWTVGSSSAFPPATSANGTQFHIGDPAATSEIVAVTNVSGTTWTVTRGAESTTPVAHAAGATFVQVTTAGWLGTVNTRLLASGDVTGATDTLALNNAIASLPTVAGLGVGKIRVGSGTFYWQGPGSISTIGPGVYLEGAGDWATQVFHVGSGDLLRVKDTTSPYSSRLVIGGGVTGITFDASNVTGTPSAALHLGDIAEYHVDFHAKNYGGSGSAALHLDNTLFWTERTWGQVRSYGCQNAVLFDVSGSATSTNSFARTDLAVTINQNNSNYNGVSLINGANVYDSDLRIRGNFTSQNGTLSPNIYSPANVAAVLTIAGTIPAGHPGAGGFAQINASRLDIQAECSAGSHSPQTIVMDTPGSNFIRGCVGVLDFGSGGPSAPNFAPSNVTLPSSGAFWFMGSGNGDSNLFPASNFTTNSQPLTVTSAFIQARGAISGPSAGTIGLFAYSGDYFDLGTLTANGTISLFAGSTFTFTPGAPQRIVVRARQAAGSSFTLKWPSNGAPTASSPSVVWAGGTAPSMTAAHNAVDFYRLETIDGATWVGTPIQNVS